VAEHKGRVNNGFSKRYGVDKLVYYEDYPTLMEGVSREKQLKKWRREWKEKLITEHNPQWKDISSDVGVDDAWVQAVKKRYNK
jgi:putative endonuclease